MAALMLPSAVLTHLKAGMRAASGPEPVLTTWWVHSIGDAGEAPKAVADDRAVRIEAALGEPGDRSGTEAGDPAQLQPNRLSRRGRLDRGDERRLAGRAGPRLPP
jgi:hypothetical protein